ncbi:MAG TPA: AraC family transcriptional regulator [Niastella sp.]
MPTTRIRKDDLEKINAAKCILEKEYHRCYTLKDIARMVASNEGTLKRYFKLVTKMTFYEYVTSIRIEKAKYLLETTELPIKKIADRLGITKTNFNRSFKKLTGVTPKQWRNNESNVEEIVYTEEKT